MVNHYHHYAATMLAMLLPRRSMAGHQKIPEHCPVGESGRFEECPVIKTGRIPNNIWKSIAMVLLGVCGSGIVSWATYVRTALTREDFRQETSTLMAPYIQQSSDLKEQLLDLKAQNAAMQKDIQALEVHVSELSEQLKEASRTRK